MVRYLTYSKEHNPVSRCCLTRRYYILSLINFYKQLIIFFYSKHVPSLVFLYWFVKYNVDRSFSFVVKLILSHHYLDIVNKVWAHLAHQYHLAVNGNVSLNHCIDITLLECELLTAALLQVSLGEVGVYLN